MKKIKTILASLSAWLILAIFLFPIYFLVTSSFKKAGDIRTSPPKLFIFEFDLSSYQTVFLQTNIKECIINSLIICFSAVFISMIVGFLAAYGLNRFNFKRKKNLSFWIISMRMGPPVVTIVPFFILAKKFYLYDKHLVLILIYLIATIPFIVWMMRGYINQVPVELDEAASIEGCNHFQIFRYIIFPLTKMGVISTAIISFIFLWNEFFFAFLLTGNNAKTVPVVIQRYITQSGLRWDELTTAGTIILIPILIISLIAGRYFIKGLLEGALKN